MIINQLIQYITNNSLTELQESADIECKLAGGRNGIGELPNSFWETYSAFANTNGGVLILGVKEHKKTNTFEVIGIENTHKIKDAIFKIANNKNKVNYNLLTDSDIYEWEIDNKTILLVSVRRASRKQQPIFLNGNPFGNTFIRQHEGDFKLTDERVKQLISEQIKDSFDGDVLPHFSLSDLDLESLQVYRQRFINFNPTSPWNDIDNQSFLTRIGGYAKNRETGEQGLTKAGLLMFGQQQAIYEVFPDYMLDYQERESDDMSIRWVDRLVPDGNWSGNLFDFYRKISSKLTQDIKTPFKLKNGERQDDTPVHIAIREALVNSLVHADYNDRASVKIIKYPNRFYFRNPGLMRVPIEVSLQGGESDCRNRTLHKMFRFIKAGEQAGSGIPNILAGWKACNWQIPSLYEKREPNYQTILELSMSDLFPHDVSQLISQYTEKFPALNADEQAILATAYMEDTINHQRLRALLPNHPADITKMLQHLVRQGILTSTGGRWAIYRLSDNHPSTGLNEPSTGHNNLNTGLNEPNTGISLTGNESNTGHNDLNTGHNEPSTGHNDLNNDENLKTIAELSLIKKRLAPQQMQQLIEQLCEHRFLTAKELADLLNRDIHALRKRHLTPMVEQNRLQLAYPDTPQHPNQAYKSTQKERPQ